MIFQYQIVMQFCKIIDDNHKNIVPIKDINSKSVFASLFRRM